MFVNRVVRKTLLITTLLLVLAPSAVLAAEDASAYRMPPQVLADIIDAPQTPAVALSPDGAWLLVLNRPGYPSIAEVAQPELRLAGLRINPRSNGRSRQLPLDGLTFRRLADGRVLPLLGGASGDGDRERQGEEPGGKASPSHPPQLRGRVPITACTSLRYTMRLSAMVSRSRRSRSVSVPPGTLRRALALKSCPPAMGALTLSVVSSSMFTS